MKIFSNKEFRREITRQSFHLLLGLILGLGVGFGFFGEFFILIAFIASLILAFLLDKGYYIPVFEEILVLCERPEEKSGLRGGGLVAFLLGALLVTIFFPNVIAAASILMLGIADSIALIVGKFYGKVKHPFGTKFIEGHGLGAVIGALVGWIFVPFWPLLMAGLVGMFFEGFDVFYELDFIDDNILVPLIVAVVLILLI